MTVKNQDQSAGSKARSYYLENIPWQEVRSILLSSFKDVRAEQEEIPVADALGRVTAKPVFAAISSPHYHASAMDGIAVESSRTFGARETQPKILTIGEDAFWVDTGDPLPPGTNAVIMVEEIQEVSPTQVLIRSAVSPWQNVRVFGEDMVQSELIVPANHKLRPVDLGAILAGGITRIAVRKKPKVAIIPTGSELVLPSDNPPPGHIIEFNSTVFAAQVESWGGEPLKFPIVPDNRDALAQALEKALETCDIALVSAGSSAGSEDFTAPVLKSLGEVLVHGAATRPGKPVIIGKVQGKPVVGVPGYPVSANLAMELYVKPLIASYLGLGVEPKEKTTARLTRAIVSPMGVDEFVRAKLGVVGGRLVAAPVARGAAITTSLVRSDGLVVIPIGKEGFPAGAEVEVLLEKPMWEIMNTVVAIGSHDPALDIIATMLREIQPEMTLSSANAGSLGGLLALKKRECHFAGTHLLDEETGEYNVSYIRRYLPNEDIVLVNLTYRQQGLMVLPGNPKGIRDLEDLTRSDIMFVNRQKGAGTRVLLDYELKKRGISSSIIRGYEREEYTHTQVAAAVKSGAADVGLGVLSAARALGLEFIPWREERYDLAIPAEYLEHPGVKAVLELVKTPAFKERLAALGGYDTRDTGKVLWRSPSNSTIPHPEVGDDR